MKHDLKFPSTAGFKPYQAFFSKESVSHPAKANLWLLKWIIENFTERGETILDPMAGTFSTCVMASLLGRNSVGLDLEERFYRMGLDNRDRVEKASILTEKGKITVLQGNARELSKILGETDAIVTSPPYEDSFRANPKVDFEKRVKKLMEVERNAVERGQKWAVSSEETIRKRVMAQDLGYSTPKADTIITSPPYEGSIQGKPQHERLRRHGRTDPKQGGPYGRSLAHGYDAIVTSPPYEGISVTSFDSPKWTKFFTEMLKDKGFIEWQGKKYSEKEWRALNHGRMDGRTTLGVPKGETGYDAKKGRRDNNENIGNLKGEAYLKAMRQIYSESYKVLKPDGRMILIVKNFIRDKAVVDLVGDTVKLCLRVGFKLVDHYLFKLPHVSFFRMLYKKKHPEVDTKNIEVEHILIFKKTPGGAEL